MKKTAHANVLDDFENYSNVVARSASAPIVAAILTLAAAVRAASGEPEELPTDFAEVLREYAGKT